MKRFRDTEYFVNKYGDVFRSEKKLKPRNSRGYQQVFLYPEKRHYKIHRMVAELYLDNPLNLPEVNHKDRNKQNNNVENLEWSTHSDNLKHYYQSL